MAKLLKLRRGTTSQHSSFTGAEGEVTIDTDKDTAVVHDGSTAAGRPLAREDLNNVASASITGRLASGAIAGAKIANGAITSAHIAADTVVAADIAANAVGTSEIAANAVTGNEIADDAINSEHYVDGSIDRVHLSNDIIDGNKIADNAIGAEHIAGNAVGSSEIAANAVGAAELANDAVDTAAIANDAVTLQKIQNISTSRVLGRISSGGGDTQELTAANVRTIINVEDGATADQTSSEIKSLLASDNINGSHIADDSINSEHYVAGSIDNEHLGANIVNASNIADNTITATQIAANAIGSSELADNAVDSNAIQGDAVNGLKIADDSINSEHYINSSIDREHLNITNTGSNGQALTRAGSQFTWTTISADGGNADTLDGINSTSFLRSDADANVTAHTEWQDNKAARFGNDNDLSIFSDNTNNFITANNNPIRFCKSGNNVVLQIEQDGDIWAQGTIFPWTNNTFDLGSTSNAWRNIYTNDLHLSNEGSANEVDGTWGSYTLQEGENDLFLLNRRNGKKYKFNLTEVS